ncbi:MAG: cobalamin biosynthesis protein CbiD [Spirochaetia bacterium]|nr:cobalamin biosynthesis protein CbiD [Spirochaetia bacterium]
MIESFITKDGKRLRRGYTTGSCAAAAAKSAALMLLTGRRLEAVHLMTPFGIELDLPLCDIVMNDRFVSCGTVKDSGDDPDVTDGITVYARVEKTDAPYTVEIDGGEGIGRVTKPGLDQSVGSAAINSTPRRMITEELQQVCEDNGYTGGLKVIISAPAGAEIAKKTFNPRLGIEGGISILGTTGIVDPMSEEALIESIALEIRQRKALGDRRLILTPGNFGADFLKSVYGIETQQIVKCSNYVGKALEAAVDAGFCQVLLAGHIGKFVKLSGGIMNTHSKEGDCRAELMAAAALLAGADSATAQAMFSCVTTDEMLRILDKEGVLAGTMTALRSRIESALSARFEGMLEIGVIVFTTGNIELFKTETAKRWMEAHS